LQYSTPVLAPLAGTLPWLNSGSLEKLMWDILHYLC